MTRDCGPQRCQGPGSRHAPERCWRGVSEHRSATHGRHGWGRDGQSAGSGFSRRLLSKGPSHWLLPRRHFVCSFLTAHYFYRGLF